MLDTLVVSSDARVISTLQLACNKLGITGRMCTAPKAIPAILARSKVYGVVIDDLDAGATNEVLNAFRQSPSSRAAVFIALYTVEPATVPGLMFSVAKPIAVDMLVSVLRLAQSQMLNEHRRYVRCPSTVPVTITTDAGQDLVVMCRDVSQRGIGLQSAALPALAPRARVCARLELPGAGSVETTGQMVWCDAGGRAGINCQGTTQRDRQLLESWIAKQQVTAESGQMRF